MQYSLCVHGLAHATCEQEPIPTWAPSRARPGSARNDLTTFRARRSRSVRSCAVTAAARVFVRTVLWTLARGGVLDLYRMPPGLHYSRSAAFVCHWHTGCNKRFSSKRKLHRHLETEHGLQRDAERGWGAPGIGSRTRRREVRRSDSLSQWRERSTSTFLSSRSTLAMNAFSDSSSRLSPSPSLVAAASAQCDHSLWQEDSADSRQFSDHCRPEIRVAPQVVAPQHITRASRVRFTLPPLVSSLSSSAPSLISSVTGAAAAASAGILSASGAQPLAGTGRQAATEPPPAGFPAARPQLFGSSAAMPPSWSGGTLTTAEKPPDTAGKPPASSADRPLFTTCDEGLCAVSFGVSPRPVPDRSPAGPCGDVDDDLWVPSPRRWNTWTRDSSVDAAKVRL